MQGSRKKYQAWTLFMAGWVIGVGVGCHFHGTFLARYDMVAQPRTAEKFSSAEVLGARPGPELTPQLVVDIQLQALQQAGDGREGIATCFEFASPSNRKKTGPLERFTQMVSGPPYDVMLQHRWADVQYVELD